MLLVDATFLKPRTDAAGKIIGFDRQPGTFDAEQIAFYTSEADGRTALTTSGGTTAFIAEHRDPLLKRVLAAFNEE